MSVVFDTEALLIFYLDELGAAKVEEYLEKIQNRETAGYLSIVNLAEFRYILCRRDAKLAEEKERNLRTFRVDIVPILDNELWRVAANIKAKYTLSLADAFAAATAKIKRAKLVTGRDEEYRSIGIPLVRLRS